MAVSDTLVELDGIHFAYQPDRPVLADCNFRLTPGERVGLIGSNGSGKTTLLRLVVGLVRADSGRLWAFGKLLASEADFHEVRCRAGLLFQDADDQLFCPTVAEDVAFGPLNLGRPRTQVHQIVAHWLARLGLVGYEDRITSKLSDGEKRLVALASVLAMEPDVLLLDEPTGALDEEHTAALIEIINRLPQAMLIVSHDHHFLRQTAARLLRLSGGALAGV